jgi:hypothetical protein
LRAAVVQPMKISNIANQSFHPTRYSALRAPALAAHLERWVSYEPIRSR